MNERESVLPTFYIVGAGKCGTSSVHMHLARHPRVFFPKLKEPHHFSSPPPAGELPSDVDYIASTEEYIRLYVPGRGFDARGDASTSYLYDERAAQRIREVSPGAKIVIMLRDPIARAHSEYLMNRDRGLEPEADFLAALTTDHARINRHWWLPQGYIGRGLYFRQVQRYFDIFGRDQVLVLLTCDLHQSPQHVLSTICRHICVDPTVLDATTFAEKANVWRAPRGPLVRKLSRAKVSDSLRRWLPTSTRRRLTPLFFHTTKPRLLEQEQLFLQQIFEPDICLLEELLDRRLPELRKSWVEYPESAIVARS